MRNPPSHLRRSLEMLDWIAASHPEAQVSLGGSGLGKWHELRVRWKLDGTRILLHMGQTRMTYWLNSVRSAPWGATMVLYGAPVPVSGIDIIWRQPRPGSEWTRRLPPAALSWVRSLIPGCRIESVSRYSDRAHSLSGNYFRVRLSLAASEHLLLLGAGEPDPVQAQEILTQALLWLIQLTRRPAMHADATTIHLMVPAGHAAPLCHRAKFINHDRVHVEVWEYRDLGGDRWEVEPPVSQPVPTEDRDFRWPVLGPFRWSGLLERVIGLAPASIRRYPRFRDYDSLRLMGLEFARVLGPERDRVTFGTSPQQVELTEENFEELRDIVDRIMYYRRPDSPDTGHPYYRMQSERWLECLLLQEATRLFPELEPASIYPQIPVYLGKVPGRVDVLGSDRMGNLVVMELKVAEDPDLPLQALDYWGRVIWHNLNGDFERRGYFAGIRLNRTPPKLYLVSPIFSFHDSFEKMMRFLSPDLEVSKIAINEDWRCGIRILRRFDFQCGRL